MPHDLLPHVPGGPAVLLVGGVLLLLAGRRLFWLLLVAVGFLAGLSFAVNYLDNQPPWLVLAVGLVTGLVAAGLAIFIQKLAVAIAGFLVGGYAAVWLLTELGTTWGLPQWAVFAIGGAVAALAALAVLDWALIAVSSVAGAILVLQVVELEPALSLAALAGLTLLGAAVQMQALKRKS